MAVRGLLRVGTLKGVSFRLRRTGKARRRTSRSQRSPRKKRFAFHEGIRLDMAVSDLGDLRAIVRSFAVCAAQDDNPGRSSNLVQCIN